MDTSQLRLGVIPMTSTDRVEVNVQNILKTLRSIENFKPDLVCFPENSLLMNFQVKLDPTFALTTKEPFWQDLGEWAKANNSYLHLGGVPILESQKVFNSSVIIEPTGHQKIAYRKIHLFDVDVQGKRLRESDSLSAGADGAVIDVKGWKVGLSICYDLRFAELFIKYHKQQVDMILVPSSFLVPTGRAHWQTLLRARAIETQSYVAAPAQVGTHQSQNDPSLPPRQTWGESLVIGPWGEIIAASSSYDQPPTSAPLLCVLNKKEITKTRTQIPLLSHRRLD